MHEERQWNEAADQYRTLIRMKPAELEYHGRLAECLFNLQKYQEAADEYAWYLEKRASDINALTNLGVAMAALERPHEATSAFRRVVTLDPRNGNAQKNPEGGTPLSPREFEILGLLSEGLRQADIAERLVLSPKTVGTHIQHILSKLGVHSRAQAVAEAYRQGLVQPDFAAHDLLVLHG